MDREKEIEEMAKCCIYHDNGKCNADITEDNECDLMCKMYGMFTNLEMAGYRKQSEIIDEFAKRLKDYPINVRLPFLGLETKEEVETYVNNLFDQIESIVDKIAEEMKGGE